MLVQYKYWDESSKEIKGYCDKNNVKYINYFYHEKLVDNKKVIKQVIFVTL